ncbi:hypothetical protein SAMN05444172_8954 [Burkholderia sp. GAS332]|nr:hypothetical protein SAMN05444172_8954 [Burkholderia sp. GAS332]
MVPRVRLLSAHRFADLEAIHRASNSLRAAQFDGMLGDRQAIGGLGAMPDTSGGPTYRFHMAVLDANLSVPFQITSQSLRYVTTVHGQFTNNTLNYIDDLTIGSRYTVRGFEGETMLAAERGFSGATSFSCQSDQPASHSTRTLTTGMCSGRTRHFSPEHNWRARSPMTSLLVRPSTSRRVFRSRVSRSVSS